jgi:hypothetical protein
VAARVRRGMDFGYLSRRGVIPAMYGENQAIAFAEAGDFLIGHLGG